MASAKKKAKKKPVTEVKSTMREEEIVEWILAARLESEQSKETRMRKNRRNQQTANLEHDFSHKKPGQSQEVLSDLSEAVEEFGSFIQQSLTNNDRWFDVTAQDGLTEDVMKIKPDEIKKLTAHYLDKAKVQTHVGKGVKSAYINSLLITKIGGFFDRKPIFTITGQGKNTKVSKADEEVWRLSLGLVRQEDYYPDPHVIEGRRKMYEVEDMWPDMSAVRALAEGPNAVYNKAKLDIVEPWQNISADDEHERNQETGQDSTISAPRARVKLTEYWGDIEDKDGNILFRNIVATVANDKHLIQRPTENPLWHQESPYVSTALREQAHTTWPQAIADAPAAHNRTATELFNLMQDGALQAANNVRIVRADWLENPDSIAEGIVAGSTLVANSKMPPNGELMDAVKTGEVPNDALQMFQVIMEKLRSSALTNAAREGALSQADVPATAIVESGNKLLGITNGIVTHLEADHLNAVVRKSWMTIVQNSEDLWDEELKSVIGEERLAQLAALSPQERFVNTVNGVKFKVTGLSSLLKKNEDFRKLTTILQTMFANQFTAEAFMEKYSIPLFVGEMMETLNLDTEKFTLSKEQLDAQRIQRAGGGGTAPANTANPSDAQGAAAPGEGPNELSQQPQAQAISVGQQLGAQLPQSAFPSGGNA